MACKHCTGLIHTKLEEVVEQKCIEFLDEQIGNSFQQTIDQYYPGLFNLLYEPWLWFGSEGSELFPVDPEIVRNASIEIEFVSAPLPLIASVVRRNCEKCGNRHRVVLVNVRFWILCMHLLELQHSPTKKPQLLAQLVKAMGRRHCNFGQFSSPARCDNEMVAGGMAWVLAHELGHFVSSRRRNVPQNLNVPAYVIEALSEELHADMESFKILLHRTTANAPLSHEKVSKLLGGIELVLRSMILLLEDKSLRTLGIDLFGDVAGAFTPSPKLRRDSINNIVTTMDKLGLYAVADFNELNNLHFDQWDKNIQSLLQEL